jgi:hypothetical protein
MSKSFYDVLATVIEAGSLVSLTTISSSGAVHTRPARALRGPFRGRIWLRLGPGETIDNTFADDSEVTVSFSSAGEGPYVTVKGWAVRLPAETLSGASLFAPQASARRLTPLVCVTATAAQLWESMSGGGPRVFAFPATDPHCADAQPALPYGRADYDHARTLAGATAHSA